MRTDAASVYSNTTLVLCWASKRATFVVALVKLKMAESMAKYRRFPALGALDKDAPARNRTHEGGYEPSRRDRGYPFWRRSSKNFNVTYTFERWRRAVVVVVDNRARHESVEKLATSRAQFVETYELTGGGRVSRIILLCVVVVDNSPLCRFIHSVRLQNCSS